MSLLALLLHGLVSGGDGMGRKKCDILKMNEYINKCHSSVDGLPLNGEEASYSKITKQVFCKLIYKL